MLALAALLLSVDAPAPETAAPLDALRILVVPRDGESAARVEDIYTGLRAAGLLPVELDERAGIDRAASPPTAPGVHDEARAKLAEAKAHFRDLDLDATRTAADAAVDEVLRLDRVEDGFDVLVDALLLKATVALQAGVEDDARTALALVSRLDPSRTELHPGLYPPSLCDAYAAARTAASTAPVASLVLRPRVAGFRAVEVLVDGQPAPPEVNAGPHLVTMRAPGTVPYARIVQLDAKEPATLAPFLAPAGSPARRRELVHAAAAAVDDDGKKTALSTLADLSAARAVLYVAGPQAALWSTRGLEVLPVSSKASGAALGRATLAALQAPARRDGAPADPPLDPVVVGVGVTAAVVVVTAAVGVGLWALWPPSPPKAPARPVYVSCCRD